MFGDGRGGGGVVARDHLHVDPGGVTGPNRGGRGGPGWIEHGLQPGERQAAGEGVGLEAGRVVESPVAVASTRSPSPARASAAVTIVGRSRGRVDPSRFISVVHRSMTRSTAPFTRTVASAVLALVKGGHVLAVRAERDRGDPRHRGGELGQVESAFGRGDEQGTFGRVADDAPGAVDVGEQGVVAGGTGDERGPQRGTGVGGDRCTIQVEDRAVGVVARARDLEPGVGGPQGADRHLVLGEGPGLVRAHHRRAAQGLDRGQPSDHGAPSSHAVHADGERDRDRGRKALGDGADRQRDRGGEHLRRALPPQDPNREREPGQAQDGEGEHLGERAQLADQRGVPACRRCRRDGGSRPPPSPRRWRR